MSDEESEKDVLPTSKTTGNKKSSKRKHTKAAGADTLRGNASDYSAKLAPFIETVKLHNELPGESKLIVDYIDEATRVKDYLDLPPLQIVKGYST